MRLNISFDTRNLEARQMVKHGKLKNFLESKNATLILLLLILTLFFWFFSPGHTFLNLRNITSILNSMTITALFVIAEALLVILGELDLSPGYVGTACGALMATLLARTALPWYFVVVICLLTGIVFGLINAVLVNEFGFQSFIATLATGAFVAKGLGYVVCNGKAIEIVDPVITWIGTSKIATIVPFAIFIALIAMVVYGIILAKSKFGRSIYICGANRAAARLAGLKSKKISYILFANSGMLGALAGMLYAARLCSGNLDGTNTYAFPALTAAILGGVSFGGGSGSILGAFLGLLIISSFNNGLLIMGLSPYWINVASGLLLLLALTLDYFANRKTGHSWIAKLLRFRQARLEEQK